MLLPLSGTLYALFLPSSHDEALKPVRDTALLFLLIGDFFHVGNYLMPVLRGEMAIGGIDVGGFLGNVGFTLVLAGARVAWFMGH